MDDLAYDDDDAGAAKKKVEKKLIKTAETGGSRQPRMSGKQKQKKAKAVVKKTKSKTETTTKKERSKTKTVVPKPDKPGRRLRKKRGRRFWSWQRLFWKEYLRIQRRSAVTVLLFDVDKMDSRSETCHSFASTFKNAGFEWL